MVNLNIVELLDSSTTFLMRASVKIPKPPNSSIHPLKLKPTREFVPLSLAG